MFIAILEAYIRIYTRFIPESIDFLIFYWSRMKLLVKIKIKQESHTKPQILSGRFVNAYHFPREISVQTKN